VTADQGAPVIAGKLQLTIFARCRPAQEPQAALL
jgi:hypothetical protein